MSAAHICGWYGRVGHEIRPVTFDRRDHRYDVAHGIGRRVGCPWKHEDDGCARRRRLSAEWFENVGINGE